MFLTYFSSSLSPYCPPKETLLLSVWLFLALINAFSLEGDGQKLAPQPLGQPLPNASQCTGYIQKMSTRVAFCSTQSRFGLMLLAYPGWQHPSTQRKPQEASRSPFLPVCSLVCLRPVCTEPSQSLCRHNLLTRSAASETSTKHILTAVP